MIGHNGVNGDQLRSIVERIERLEEEKRAISADIADVYKEAKGEGFDPKIMRIIVRDRRLSDAERAERDALIETYQAALGELADTPLGRKATAAAAVTATAGNAATKAAKSFVDAMGAGDSLSIVEPDGSTTLIVGKDREGNVVSDAPADVARAHGSEVPDIPAFLDRRARGGPQQVELEDAIASAPAP